MHRKAGVKMTMPTDTVRLGDVVRLRFGVGPVAMRGSCDVISVPTSRAGGAFATAPGPTTPKRAKRASPSTGPLMMRWW